jgi:hypothetical protein
MGVRVAVAVVGDRGQVVVGEVDVAQGRLLPSGKRIRGQE